MKPSKHKTVANSPAEGLILPTLVTMAAMITVWVSALALRLLPLIVITSLFAGASTTGRDSETTASAPCHMTLDGQLNCDPSSSAAYEEDVLFILRLMDLVRSPLTPKKRDRVATLVARVGQTIALENRRSWYGLLAVESKFIQASLSDAGAVGIGQIVPLDCAYLSRITNIRVTSRLLRESIEMNLIVSARFYAYMAANKGSQVLALVAYNAGMNSQDVMALGSVTSINYESANYLAKHSYLMESVNLPNARGGRVGTLIATAD